MYTNKVLALLYIEKTLKEEKLLQSKHTKWNVRYSLQIASIKHKFLLFTSAEDHRLKY